MNVLVYAFQENTPEHVPHREWLIDLVQSEEAYAVSDHVLSGFLRIVTHSRIFHPPAPIDAALAFANAFRQQPNAVTIQPGSRHWEIFTRLCSETGAHGNLIPDAWLAALAIESGCEFITTDRDFARFAGLRWRHPLAEHG